ncbi:MAG: hypothetical protein ACREUF_07045 [Solimonas sp.]
MAPIDHMMVLAGGLIANIVFNNFEKHLPVWRRCAKFAVLVSALAVIGALFGRLVFYVALAALTLGQVVLHAWWFPRHGINGLTAEPYDRYLALIARMKHRRRD